MPKLAIEDPVIGPRLREIRVLTPDEVKTVELLKTIKKVVMKLDALDKEMAGRLEAALDDHDELRKLTEAYLSEDERIRMGYWPEGNGFGELEEARLIQEFVVETYRPELKGYRIACLFQEKIPPVNRRGRLGTQMRIPGKMRYLSKWDACTSLGYDDWRFLSDADRQRLIHHELEHLEVGENGLMLRSHDFEDFVSIFTTYGPASESGRFSGDSLQKIYGAESTSQFDLMEKTG